MYRFDEIHKNVKQLFLRNKFKQCVAVYIWELQNESHELHSLAAPFLSFYAGLSYDALARGMSMHTTTLDETLDDAEKLYHAAQQVLRESTFQLDSGFSINSFPSNASHTSSGRRSATSFGSTVSQNSELSSPASSTWSQEEDEQVVKRMGSYIEDPRKDMPTETDFLPQDTPLSFDGNLASLTHDCIYPSSKESDRDGDQALVHLRNARIRHRYETDVAVFCSMIRHHIASIQEFKRSVASRREVQDALRSESSSPTTELNQPSGSKEKQASTMEQEKFERIREGRERKWKRTRFDPEKYQKLCDSALSEL
ncbi:hypothetical protein NA57DRAFT_55510 [Rhizodiscina lignyota]|uniref:Uncharacterized protein n=1 Tax=Rhizodiscina lignyota TaxID=1504668 RepID=A0A9P4M6A9_9PEZI|nr:hypothetical protein NA57DRAFT_55510 [Rhizodiscina lignyota]